MPLRKLAAPYPVLNHSGYLATADTMRDEAQQKERDRTQKLTGQMAPPMSARKSWLLCPAKTLKTFGAQLLVIEKLVFFCMSFVTIPVVR